MDRERAETYLRGLAEVELRHVTRRARVPAGRWSADRAAATLDRMSLVAMALIGVRALDIETAEAALADYADALGARPRSDRVRPMLGNVPPLPRGPWRAPWFTWPTVDSQVRLVSSQAAHSPSPGQRRPARLVPLGLTGRYCRDGMDGTLHLLSYSRTSSGARFVIAWPVSSPAAGGGQPLPAGLLRVTDDRGTCYHLSFAGPGGSDPVGELGLHPDPPDDVEWFELTPPGGPALRVKVNPGTPPDDTRTWVRETGLYAGEHLLNQYAERLLVSSLRFARDWRQRSGGPDGAWLGDVVAALEAVGALSPVSPVPGRVAALCASLGAIEHGITAPASHDLPQPWLSLLGYQRRKPDPPPAWDGFAAVAAALPELDGIRLALLGVLSLGAKTVLYLRAGGQGGPFGPFDQDIPLSVWVRDSDDRWHAADLEHWSRDGREHVLTLHLLPPLSSFAAWIELVVAGPSSEVRARLPLRWQ